MKAACKLTLAFVWGPLSAVQQMAYGANGQMQVSAEAKKKLLWGKKDSAAAPAVRNAIHMLACCLLVESGQSCLYMRLCGHACGVRLPGCACFPVCAHTAKAADNTTDSLHFA